MIILTKNIATTNEIYVTPYELSGGIYYDFWIIKFTNRVTQNIVELPFEDESDTLRYQKFSVDIYPFNGSNYFENEDNGLWSCEVYGSNDGSTKDSDILESGFMYLKNNDNFIPTTYNEQSNEFLTYNG